MYFNEKHEILLKNGEPLEPATQLEENNTQWTSLRDLLFRFPEPKMTEILKEYQVWNWKRRQRYCGTCGAQTVLAKDSSLECEKCGEKYFPAQFPAVIVMVQKGDQILLAHNANFPEGLYSVVAGFVDMGESCEQAVEREVLEEIGIRIKNIKYFGSQNWGFSTSLMLAFTAEWDSGEIKVDGEEIEEAKWVSKEGVMDVPQLPPKFSIGYQLIDSFIKS